MKLLENGFYELVIDDQFTLHCSKEDHPTGIRPEMIFKNGEFYSYYDTNNEFLNSLLIVYLNKIWFYGSNNHDVNGMKI